MNSKVIDQSIPVGFDLMLGYWRKHFQRLARLSGVPAINIAPGSDLWVAADTLYQYVFGQAPVGDVVDSSKVIAAVDLLLLASVSDDQQMPGLCMPKSFWSEWSGRMIVWALKKSLEDDFCLLMRASKELGFQGLQLYRLAYRGDIPVYVDVDSQNPRRRNRVRMDQLRILKQQGFFDRELGKDGDIE